ncbi:MAG: DNA-processing protein DprA [Mycobacteriales bacterium]
MSGVDRIERVARAGLTRVCEPDDIDMRILLATVGPVDTWCRLVVGDVSGPLAARTRARVEAARPDADLQAITALRGRLLCPGDAEWPVSLDDLPAPPVALWVRGRGDLAALAHRSVAVVGSRAATSYGMTIAADLSAGLADLGWHTVSGGAYGIDAAAHRGSLAAGGTTVAVLACGVDVPYPRGHDALFSAILASGVVLSEWPPGCAPMRHRFLTRNRVIAALGRGTVVVEAAVRSGALRTARDADTIGRPVMAVPGPVTSAMSAGCHELLRREGTICVTRPEEIIEAVGRIGDDLAPALFGPELIRDTLSAEVSRVLDAVPARRPATTDAIVRTSGLAPSSVRPALGALVAAGLVERVDGAYRQSAQ